MKTGLGVIWMTATWNNISLHGAGEGWKRSFQRADRDVRPERKRSWMRSAAEAWCYLDEGHLE